MRDAMPLGRLCHHHRCQGRTARAWAASMAVRVLREARPTPFILPAPVIRGPVLSSPP
jgi:hypothetical protein